MKYYKFNYIIFLIFLVFFVTITYNSRVVDTKNNNEKLAISFLITSKVGEDGYNDQLNLLKYQLCKHKKESKNKNIDIIVLSIEKKKITGIKAKNIIVNDTFYKGKHSPMERYNRLYTKLAIFNMTEYDRILYSDSDILWRKSIMETFEECGLNHDFCGTKDVWTDDNKNREPNSELYVNAGLLVVRPSKYRHDHMISLLETANYYDAYYAEQDFLNWYYGANKKIISNKFNTFLDCNIRASDINLHIKMFHPECYNTYKNEYRYNCGIEIL
jgi:alpha-N-acetylglucosamine transferase